MHTDDDNYNYTYDYSYSYIIDEKQPLKIIPSNQLRLIPLESIIIHIYNKIIEKAINYEFSYNFNFEKLTSRYEIDTKILTQSNKMMIIDEIKRLFSGIEITEINDINDIKEKTNNFNSWKVCWEENISNDNITEITEWEDVSDDDFLLKQKKINNSISIKKNKRKINKSHKKLKKLNK